MAGKLQRYGGKLLKKLGKLVKDCCCGGDACQDCTGTGNLTAAVHFESDCEECPSIDAEMTLIYQGNHVWKGTLPEHSNMEVYIICCYGAGSHEWCEFLELAEGWNAVIQSTLREGTCGHDDFVNEESFDVQCDSNLPHATFDFEMLYYEFLDPDVTYPCGTVYIEAQA